MQYETKRGLLSVDRMYVDEEDARKDGFTYVFPDCGKHLYSKCLDDRGFRHSFALITTDQKDYQKLYQWVMNKLILKHQNGPVCDNDAVEKEFKETATPDLIVGYYVKQCGEYAYRQWTVDSKALDMESQTSNDLAADKIFNTIFRPCKND